MKLRLLILLAAALAASPAAGQTIKSLGYNTTNGQVVYSGSNTLTFTNPLNLTNTVRVGVFGQGGATGFAGRTSGGNLALYGTNVTSAQPFFYGFDGFNNTAFSAGVARTNLGLSTTDAVTFQGLVAELLQVRVGTNLYVGLADDVSEFWTDVAVNGELSVNDLATFSTNVTVNGNLSVGSLTTTTPSTWALDATQTAAATNGILALPSNANVIRLTNNTAISGVTNGVLGAFYYLVNQTTNAVTISNVGGITVQGGTSLTLGVNQAATLVATGATNASVAARGDLTDVALGGTANTAPSQTASSGSSLMTRDLGDARYSGFTGLQILPMEYSRCSQNLTNGGAISIARGNVRLTSGVTNGSGGGLTFSDGRMFYTTQGTSTAHQGYGIYALNPQLLANTDTVFGIFYGSAPANGVPSFEPLSTNGYSVQLRNNGTNQLRYVYKNGTNEVSGPWTSLPVVGSSSVQFAGINTTNGFRVLYRRPTGLGTADWTVLTNVAVSWTWQGNPQSAGAQFSAISFIRTNTTSTNSLINDAGEFGFIIGGENL